MLNSHLLAAEATLLLGARWLASLCKTMARQAHAPQTEQGTKPFPHHLSCWAAEAVPCRGTPPTCTTGRPHHLHSTVQLWQLSAWIVRQTAALHPTQQELRHIDRASSGAVRDCSIPCEGHHPTLMVPPKGTGKVQTICKPPPLAGARSNVTVIATSTVGGTRPLACTAAHHVINAVAMPSHVLHATHPLLQHTN